MTVKEKIAEKLLKRKIEKEVVTEQPGADENSNEETSRGRSKSPWGRIKNKFKKKSRDGSNTSTAKTTEEDENELDDDAMDRLGLKEAEPEANFGRTVFHNSDHKGTWNVLVRVIEGKDLPNGALRVRAILDGRQKATRTCTEGVPHWRQNLSFSFKKMTLEKLASEPLTLNVTSVGKFRENVGATFSVLMSAVLHSENRAIVSKWIALHSPTDEEDEELKGENCGFLKVSLCVYGDSPPHMNDDLHSDEVWSGAQLEDHTLRIRVFRILHLAEELSQIVAENTKKKPFQFLIRINMGKLKMETASREIIFYKSNSDTNAAVSLEQEAYLPLQWPTVIQKIRFELIMKQGKKRRILGQASLPMRCLYEAGEDGFMPTFGPAFVNFYGHETLQRLKWKNEKQPIDETVGSKYLARLLCSIDAVEYCGESAMIADLGHGPLNQFRQCEKTNHYNLYCSFQAANMINPIYASKPISFHVSMGEYGSTGYGSANYRASTFSAMPDTDKQKYFFMPWGNHRPLAEILTMWENVDRRMSRHNAISKVASMLTEIQREIAKGGGLPPETASLCVEALDHAEELMDRLVRIPRLSEHASELDKQWEETRKKRIKETLEQLDNLRWEEEKTQEEAIEKVVRLLARVHETIISIAEEVQISLPAVLIKMLAGEEVVGYAKINPVEIYYNNNDALSGEWCGRMRTINLKWPTRVNRKNRREEFPGVLHVRMWFGKRGDAHEWEELMRPAEKKVYLEVYVHQKKSKLNRKEWKSWTDGPAYSDEHGLVNMEETVARKTFGYEHLGNWICRTSHDMWICQDLDRPNFVERVWEVEKRTEGDWKFDKYTDYYGGETEISMKTAPSGWEYLEKWSADKHTNHGDKHGWVYSLSDEFWGEPGTVDTEEKKAHRYRRRCITRTRRAVEYKRDFEELAKLEKGNDKGWEYAASFKSAWHSSDIAEANVRRRRFMVEVERAVDLPASREHENFFLPRIYEVHHVTTTWELRCYLLWAKDLMPIIKNSAAAFVRVTFLTRCQQSIVVANSQNPIWCETLIFAKIPIPGGRRQIFVNPPEIIVEVRGERPDDSEIFLGRFTIQPTVICGPGDQRARANWNQLLFPKGKTRGAVLAAFELFYLDPRKDNLPLVPMRKAKMPNSYEVPAELKPKFERYAVQLLCWGVRNMKKHKLLSVKKPFVEFLIGDNEIYSDTIANTAKNPNFTNPLINIQEVQMPSALELAPPMVINLHDTRAFRRHPIVGYCHISDFTKYLYSKKIVSKSKRSEENEKTVFKKLVENETIKQGSVRLRKTLTKEGEPPLDWWSKYYYSQGLVRKAPGFEESGMETMAVYKDELEKVNGYNNFTDFLDTFTLFKCSAGNFDNPEEKQKTGELKAKLFITRLADKKPAELPAPPGVEFTGVTKCLLRVYVVEARGLISSRRSGLCDPYLVVKCGKQKKNLKKKYRPDTLEPLFGELIEMEVSVPLEKDLTITLMDRRRILIDEEIGSTTVDIENRLLTKWRGTAGLCSQYTIHGELPWRDQVTPLLALQRYCTKMMIPMPTKLSKERDWGLQILGIDVWYSDVRKQWFKEDEKLQKRLARFKAAGEENEKEKKKGDESDDEESKVKKFNAWADQEEECRLIATLKKSKKAEMTTEERIAARKIRREEIVGRPLECVALHILHMMNLVPEHVETRTLHSQLAPNISAGELRLFVDILPSSVGSIPAPLDISPRQPEKYELRVAVLHVSDAIAVKKNFGVPICDLYVKVFINGQQKTDRTDIHYRSEDGTAEFNWRFLLPVDFNPWEQRVVAYRKTRLFRKAREELVEPLMIVQLWDKNTFKKDTLLGEMAFDMTSFSEGLYEPEEIRKYTRRRRKNKGCCCSCSRRCCLVRCCCFLKDTRCCLKIRKARQQPLPKASRYEHPDENKSLSLFETGSIRGWWPVLSNEIQDEQKEDHTSRKKKDDDYDPDALYVMGLVELEMQLLPIDQAQADPVGKKRKDPNHSPHLDKPKRSRWNMFWFTSRMKPCFCWFWHKIGIQCLFWILIVLLVIIIIWGLVTNWPMIMIALFK